MAHLIERAASGRAKCRGCGRKIAAGEWRLGERLPNPFADDGGEMTHWYHPVCAAYRRPEAFLETAAAPDAPAIDDRDPLLEEARLGVAHHRLPRASTAARAPTGRAACRSCREPIAKDTWRISLVFYEDGRFTPAGFVHAACARAYFETDAVLPRVRHFSPELPEAEVGELAALIG
jgi:hypothetical protein